MVPEYYFKVVDGDGKGGRLHTGQYERVAGPSCSFDEEGLHVEEELLNVHGRGLALASRARPLREALDLPDSLDWDRLTFVAPLDAARWRHRRGWAVPVEFHDDIYGPCVTECPPRILPGRLIEDLGGQVEEDPVDDFQILLPDPVARYGALTPASYDAVDHHTHHHHDAAGTKTQEVLLRMQDGDFALVRRTLDNTSFIPSADGSRRPRWLWDAFVRLGVAEARAWLLTRDKEVPGDLQPPVYVPNNRHPSSPTTDGVAPATSSAVQASICPLTLLSEADLTLWAHGVQEPRGPFSVKEFALLKVIMDACPRLLTNAELKVRVNVLKDPARTMRAIRDSKKKTYQGVGRYLVFSGKRGRPADGDEGALYGLAPITDAPSSAHPTQP